MSPVLPLELALTACGDSTTPGACRSDSDCVSTGGGACINGACHDITGKDGGAVDSAGQPPADLTSATPVDGGHDLARPGGDGGAPSCSFNGDGRIDRSEAPFLVGLGGLYTLNGTGTTATVDVQPHGGIWDFSAAQSGDVKAFDQLLDPTGQWWASHYPTATFASHLGAGQPLLGVYSATATQLLLLGIVSETSGLSQTELDYTTPVPVLEFPLVQGQKWTAESDLHGTYSGNAFFTGHDKYAFTVDARGTTIVPAGRFDTLRLRVDLSQTVGFLTTTHIQFLHVAECWGTVARVQSKDNESSGTFTQAVEYRRLASP